MDKYYIIKGERQGEVHWYVCRGDTVFTETNEEKQSQEILSIMNKWWSYDIHKNPLFFNTCEICGIKTNYIKVIDSYKLFWSNIETQREEDRVILCLSCNETYILEGLH